MDTRWTNCLVRVRCCWDAVSSFDGLQYWTLSPVSLIPVHFLTSAIMDYYYILHLFPVSASSISFHRVIAYVFCHVGVLVCMFVVTVADLGLCHWKVGYRILNCIITFWSLILVSNFSLGVSSSFYQSHFCCSYCFIYSFPFRIRCVGCYCTRFLFVGMVHQILRKLGRCQMTQLIKLIIN